MIGLIFLYYIGKVFYDLAKRYNKASWPFAIMGVVVYYLGLFVGAFVVGLLFEVFSPGTIDNYSDGVIGLMALPLGFLSCWVTYKLLRNNWSSKPIEDAGNILDSNI